ncbi:MAG: YIP1 family protein [Oscillospiraceae bacterium]|jgi:tetratricopeptide (TPR) repeat protein|nr:YIP1 family protein [Oscillospiraceae bacterium]
MKKWFGLIMVLLLALPSAALAVESTTYSYTLSIYYDYIRTQDAYTPGGVMLRELELKSPEDLFLIGQTMYIADTGNARVLRYQMDTGLVTVIGQGLLQRPTGVCAAEDGTLYVADYGAAAIYRFDADGQLQQTIQRPDNTLYGASTVFKPQKVDLDTFGNLYATSEGTHEGILQFDARGVFAGFFGANRVEDLSIIDWITDRIYTQEQKDKMARRNPQRIVNLAVSDQDLVYSLTQFNREKAVKKLNMAGINILEAYSLYADDNVVDVAVGRDNVFYTLTDMGNVIEYSDDGYVLLAFGGRAVASDRNGLTSVAAAICVDDDHNVYVLDKQRGVVQPYAATDFAKSIHQALEDFSAGRYAESADIWQEFIRLTPMASFAHSGYGRALWQMGEYEQAKIELELAWEREYASQAFWEIRNRWLIDNLSTILISLVALAALLGVLSFLNKKYRIFAPVQQKWQRLTAHNRAMVALRTVRRTARHPIDTFDDIRLGLRGDMISASIVYLLAFAVYMLDIAFTAQLFNSWELNTPYSNPILVAGAVLVPGLLFVVGNYFIASINDGEGSFRHVFIAMGYALSVYACLTPVATLLSYAVTMNEAFILTLLRWGTLGYTGILVFLAAKRVHDYSFGQTIKNLLLTLCFVLLALVTLIILYMLYIALYDFIKTLVEEVRLRA